MTTTEKGNAMRVPPSPDAPCPSERTPEPVRGHVEFVTDRALIRDSDEADEPTMIGRPSAAMVSDYLAGKHGPPSPEVVALLLDDARHLLRLRSDALARVIVRAEAAEAERDAALAKVAAVEALAEQGNRKEDFGYRNAASDALLAIAAALATGEGE